ESCHAAGKPFRDAKKECIACHRKEEPHEGKLGRDCGSCHDESAWRHISYDHDKTAFPLRDQHAEAPCAACHFGNRYKGTPKECASGHDREKWRAAKFDCARVTTWPTSSQHNRAISLTCHAGNVWKRKQSSQRLPAWTSFGR